MLFSSFPDYNFFNFFLKFLLFLLFFKSHCNFINLTAFLSLIRVAASHEAYMKILGNTFMTTIACSLNLMHMNLGTYQ